MAVLVSIPFETWSDGKGPSYFPRTTPLKPGTVDRGAIQWALPGDARLQLDRAHARDRTSTFPATTRSRSGSWSAMATN